MIHICVYWIARQSLSSGARSRDPLAGDDGENYSAACCATVGIVPATVARRMSRGCDWS